jgi:hypothetical protein
MRNSVFVIFGVFSLLACETSPEIVTNNGLDYFPLKVGAYQIYSVEDTQISQSIEQKFSYELKHLIIDSSVNLEGGYSYIIQRQKRDNANLPWESMDAWTSRITDRQAIVKEGNTSYVKITFPTLNGLEWNGNSFNTLGGDQSCGENKDRPCDVYKLEGLSKEFILADGITFAETLTIIQNENTDLIVKQDVRKEVYAKGVGLIFKESVVLEYCTTPNCLGDQKVNKGLRYKQTIKAYGSE